MRKTHVNLNSNGVQACREPACHAEGDVHRRHQLHGRAAEVCADGCYGFEVTIVDQARAGWVLLDESLCVADDIEEFDTRLDCPEVAGGRDDLSGNDHDDAEGDDGGELEGSKCQCKLERGQRAYAYVEPSPEHPCSVLIDLQHLDVVDGESEADSCDDEQSANPRLCRECSAEGFAGNHDSANIGNDC